MEKSLRQKDVMQYFFDHIKNALDKYLKDMDGLDELKGFMSNEENLYDKDGQPTAEYRKWIQEVENYCEKNPQIGIYEKPLEGQDELSDGQKKIISASRKYFDEVQVMRESYHSATDKEAWIRDYLGNDSEKLQFLDKLLEQETLKAKDSIDKKL